MITVVSGANENSYETLSGKTVAQVRSLLSQLLNIDPESKASVNGTDVGESHIVQDGDEVVFSKKSGEKG